MNRVWRIHSLKLWFSILSVILQTAHGASFSEVQIKAVYLFNFAEFIRWPENAFSGHPDTFQFCALTSDSAVIHTLKKVITGETSKGRKLVFRRINNPQELKGCQILYLQDDELSRFNEFSLAITNNAVLSVSDKDGFIKWGGMITLSQYNNRLKPTINIKHLEQAGLKASAKLLRLATLIDNR